MAGDLYINMSGQNIPVFKDALACDQQIGTIYPREAFSSEYGDGFAVIWFRNSSGNLTLGYIPDVYWQNIEVSKKAFTLCTAYPYGTVTLNNIKYSTFKFRRNEEVYTANGSPWGTVASGMEVACKSPEIGDTHPDWKSIYYVKSSKTGEWVPIGNEGKDVGFVDIGLNQGSMPSTISMYGTW